MATLTQSTTVEVTQPFGLYSTVCEFITERCTYTTEPRITDFNRVDAKLGEFFRVFGTYFEFSHDVSRPLNVDVHVTAHSLEVTFTGGTFPASVIIRDDLTVTAHS